MREDRTAHDRQVRRLLLRAALAQALHAAFDEFKGLRMRHRREMHRQHFPDVTTDDHFDPLPANFHFVNAYCVLLGGESSDLKVTWCNFCAETEMADMLKIKAATKDLSTDKIEGKNCTSRTEPLLEHDHRVVISIGNEPVFEFGPLGRFYLSDLNNALFENERHIGVSYRNRSADTI